MADESVPSAADRGAITPTPRPAPHSAGGPAPRQPVKTPAPASSTAAWLKAELSHYSLASIGGALVCAGAYWYGFDFRLAIVAGVAAVLFLRGLTHHILPEYQSDSTSGSATPSAGQPTDTLREIIETIVFVVVLVLLLKSFVAEAFVIPTGSMATTLWGYQKVVKCPECGYEFPVNSSTEADPQDGQAPIPVRGCKCPNCRYGIEFGAKSHIDPAWNSGDRVLVAKFLYDLLRKIPDRLDVVVFKFPGDSGFSETTEWPHSGPFGHNQVPMNYIKRLIGLPGEVIAIHGGNLYRIPSDRAPDEVRRRFAEDESRFEREGQNAAWRRPRTFFDSDARDFFNKYRDLFQIIRKPPETMLAMRRIVYDNDFPARDLLRSGLERWIGTTWSADGQGFKHPRTSEDTDWLRYRHVLRGNEGKPELITDFMGYNTPTFGSSLYQRDKGSNWVADLMLECQATVDKAEGGLVLELSRGVDRFQARFDLATGICKLFRLTGNEEKEIASEPTAVKKPGTYQLRFADFDERLTVWVDRDLPFGDGVTYLPPAESGPREENDLKRPVSIGVQTAAVRVNHLQVWRNTYYTVGQHWPSDGDAGVVDFGDPKTWDKLQDLPVRTTEVRAGHFLCLGDNSPESSDGRTWGLVPERLLLGRALLIYWPATRAGRIH